MAAEDQDATGRGGERLSMAIASYLEAVDRGERPDEEEVLARHPELAPELAAFFAGQREVEKEIGRLGALVPAPAAQAAKPLRQEGFEDYEVLEEIARGGMGVVYKARQKSLKRLVALKMVLAGRLATAEEVRRFQQEAEAAARLEHPNIVAVYEVGTHEGQHYLAMELLEGGSLAENQARYRDDVRAAAQVIETVARAVHYAHLRGVLHRDLKPANILFDREGSPHVADFGLARALGAESTLTRSGDIVGTPTYMAPELARGRKAKLSPAVDVWGLGAVLYELLAGRPPFHGDSTLETLNSLLEEEPQAPRAINPAVPRDAEAICLKCLEKDPRRRYPSAAALADDLQRFLAGRPIEARRTSSFGRTWRWCRRKPALASLLASVAALVVVLVAGSLVIAWQLREKHWETYTANLAQARARRVSGRAGQRFESLELIAEAASFRPTLELRNEAIQCLVLPDLELLEHVDGFPGQVRPTGTHFGLGVDASLERYAYGAEDGTVRVRRIEGDGGELALPGSGKPPLDIAFSPSGRFLAAYHGREPASWTLRVWDLDRPQSPVIEEEASALDFGTGPHGAVIGRKDGSIALLEFAPPREVRSLHPVSAGAGGSGANASAEESKGAIAGLRSLLDVFQAQVPKDSPQPLALHSLRIVKLQPGGRWVALRGRPARQRVYIADLESGQVVATLSHPRGQSVERVAWHPDGIRLATSCLGHEVYVWEAKTGKRSLVLKSQGAVTSIAFSHDGSLLATTSFDSTLRLWDARSGRQRVVASGDWGARFSPDDRRLASMSIASKLWLWKVADGRELRVLYDPRERAGAGPPERFFGLDVAPGGSLLAVAGSRGVSLWDLASRKMLGSLAVGGLRSALFEKSGSAVLLWSNEGLWRWAVGADGSTPDSAERLALRSEKPVGRAALGRDGRTLLAVTDSEEGEAVVFDVERAEVRARLRGPPKLLFVDLSPDGRWAAGGTWRGTGVRVWEAASGEEVVDLAVEGNAQVGFSPDGERLVTAASAEYRAWEVGSWRPVWRLARENPGVLNGELAFSADGRQLAVLHSLTDLKLIDPATGLELAALAAPDPEVVKAISFTPSGSHFVAACEDATVQVWDLGHIRKQLSELGLAE